MSGVTGDNPYRASGVIAAAAAGGGVSWQDVVTGSTLTAEAGNGYWIDTTSNACTITLPASASNGDEIIFADYDRTWGTNGIVIDSNGLNYQSEDDTFNVEYGTDGQALHIVYSDATNGWIPISDEDVADKPSKGNAEGIIGFGHAGGTASGLTNLISTSGVVSSDVAAVGTARWALAATQYGGDKGIFAYGYSPAIGQSTLASLISNTGVVAADAAGAGTARSSLAACSYGTDLGIFCYGNGPVGMSNLVTNLGVVGSDVTGVGTATQYPGACEYGGDKGIFYGGTNGSKYNISHLVSNVGVISADQTGVGTAREACGGCSYNFDKGIMAYGTTGSVTNISNLISSSGVVATDTAGVGTSRAYPGACEYEGG